MSWSCAAAAGDVLRSWCDACAEQTGSSNVYEVNGRRYFFEVSGVEHRDGAITGSCWTMTDGNHAKKVGSFRIDPQGHCARAPAFLKAVKVTRRQRGIGSGG